MKKLFFLILLSPLFFLGSCHDDNDFPEADLTLSLKGVTQVDNKFYAVEGASISIEGLTVSSTNGKNTALSNIMFYFDGLPIFSNPDNPDNPYDVTFCTYGIESGTYELGVSGQILQVDKTMVSFIASYPVTIVRTEEDLPMDAPPVGVYSSTVSMKKNN